MVHINETDCFLVGVPGLEPVTWLVIALHQQNLGGGHRSYSDL